MADLATEQTGDAKPTAGFQRVVQRAAIHVQSAGLDVVTGANVLIALFSERESHAVYFLQSQDMTRLDAVSFYNHSIVKFPNRTPPHKKGSVVPEIPAQGIGPHVEINPEGVISFAPPDALDQHGNHLPRLRALHPDIGKLARELR